MKISKLFNLILWGMIVLFAHACDKTETQQVRILTGGIRHESNTFCPYLTKVEHFFVFRDEAALKNRDWAKYLQQAGVEIIPTLHAYARPYGVVERETFEKFQREILDGARKAGRVDGVFLDMHGALHVEGYEDAQLDFIKALREIIGEEILISGSFDLHGNVSQEFVSHLDILTAYRTAPHVDGAETRVRAVRLLLNAIKQRQRPVIAHVTIPILIPGEKGITSVEPLKSLYWQLPDIAKKEGLLDASIFVGYAWADVKRSAMSVQVVAQDTSYLPFAKQEARRLAREVWDSRTKMDFDVPVAKIDQAIRLALGRPEKTVFITDSGDNTTAGAAGDNPLVLERLLAHGVKDAVVAGIADAEAVQACEQADPGAEVKLKIGGQIDYVFGKPFQIQGIVRNVVETDENEKAAVVEVDGVLIVLLSKRRSFTSPQDFEEVGINPLAHKIIVVKLGYLFAGLREIAPYTIMALTPGFAYQDLVSLPYKHVHRPSYPLDPGMSWTPE